MSTGKIQVNSFELRAAASVFLAASATLEAAQFARLGFPITFAFSQVALAPILVELARLANNCAIAADNYERCEIGLGPAFIFDFEAMEPMLAQTLAGSALTALSRLGLGETPVAAPKVGGMESSAPTNLQELLTKLHQTSTSGQIWLEQTQQGQDAAQSARHFNLYLPGTKSANPFDNSEVFGAASDLAAFANPNGGAFSSGPERAALAALKEAGFGTRAGDSLTLVGYSEGALAGANLASSGAAVALGGSVIGLVAVGGPISNRAIPAGIKVVSLEHRGDLVPKLDLAEHSSSGNWTTVKLKDVPGDGLKQHEFAGYQKSVNQLSADSRRQLNHQIAGLLGTGKTKVSRYQPVRLGITAAP